MKFSFIIPVYNAEKTIEECLQSILTQKNSDLEIICVDDCSVDNSVSIIQETQKKDKRVVLICNESNVGTLMSRKKGVLSATGDYILFADNDDVYLPNACSVIQQELEENPVDILMYNIETIHNQQNITLSLAESFRTKQLLTPIPENYIGENCLGVKNRISLLWNKAVKADVCKNAYSLAEDIYLTITEDRYASFLIHYYAKSFRTIETCLYRWNATSGVSTRSKRTVKQFERLCSCMADGSKAIERFLRKTNNDELLKQIEESGNGLGYCISEWCHSVDSDNSVETMEILLNSYDKTAYRLMHDKINYIESERDKYMSMYMMLCKSKVFRIYFFLYRKVFKIFDDICL